MTYLWILFIVLEAVAIGFGLLTLWHLYNYIKRYRFDESKYTLLFRFIHLHWIMVAYIIFAMIWVAISYLIFTLV